MDGKTFENRDIFLNNAEAVFALDTKTLVKNTVLSIFPFLSSFFSIGFMAPDLNEWFLNLTKQAIEMRQQSTARDDFLNFLVELKTKKNRSVEDLSGHAFTFFLDGFETSSHFLSSALNELAKNEHIQTKLRAEVLSVNDYDWDEINRLPYLDNVFDGNYRYLSIR